MIQNSIGSFLVLFRNSRLHQGLKSHRDVPTTVAFSIPVISIAEDYRLVPGISLGAGLTRTAEGVRKLRTADQLLYSPSVL
jgi:hypothetical protein